MSAEKLLNETLLASDAVTRKVGRDRKARIYPDFKPVEAAVPSVAYQRSATDPNLTIHSIVSKANDVTFQVVALDKTRPSAEQLADAVITSLSEKNFRLQNRWAEYDVEVEVYVVLMTFLIWELD